MACWLKEHHHSSPACLCRARHGRPVTGRPGTWGAGFYQPRPSQRPWRPSEDLLFLCSWERKLPFISETQAWLEPRAGGQGARAPPATSLLAQQSSGVNHPAPPEASVGFRMLQPSGLRQMPAFQGRRANRIKQTQPKTIGRNKGRHRKERGPVCSPLSCVDDGLAAPLHLATVSLHGWGLLSLLCLWGDICRALYNTLTSQGTSIINPKCSSPSESLS